MSRNSLTEGARPVVSSVDPFVAAPGRVGSLTVSELKSLADSTRTAICHELASSDRSPTELGGLVRRDRSTITRHVHRLRQVRLVRARVSDHDARQKYLSLSKRGQEIFAATTPIASPTFVCWNGAELSQLAATVWHSLTGQPARAFGVRPTLKVHPGVTLAAQKVGISFRPFPPIPIPPNESWDGGSNPIIVLSDRAWESWATQAEAVRHLIPARNLIHWSIPDPRSDDRRTVSFRSIVEEIHMRCERAASTVPS